MRKGGEKRNGKNMVRRKEGLADEAEANGSPLKEGIGMQNSLDPFAQSTGFEISTVVGTNDLTASQTDTRCHFEPAGDQRRPFRIFKAGGKKEKESRAGRK